MRSGWCSTSCSPGKPLRRARSPNELPAPARAHTVRAVDLIPDIDPAVERAILRCLERDPARRPASALAVAAALPGGDPLAARSPRARRRRRKWWRPPDPMRLLARGGDFAAGHGPRQHWRRLVAHAASCTVQLVPLGQGPQELQVRARDHPRGLGYGTATADSEASIRLRVRTYPVVGGGRRRIGRPDRGTWSHAVTVLLHLPGRVPYRSFGGSSAPDPPRVRGRGGGRTD